MIIISICLIVIATVSPLFHLNFKIGFHWIRISKSLSKIIRVFFLIVILGFLIKGKVYSRSKRFIQENFSLLILPKKSKFLRTWILKESKLEIRIWIFSSLRKEINVSIIRFHVCRIWNIHLLQGDRPYNPDLRVFKINKKGDDFSSPLLNQISD